MGEALRVKKPPSVREVARRAGGREPRLCPKPSCLREALSPTACGRSPLPEGAKEFFDNLGFPLGERLSPKVTDEGRVAVAAHSRATTEGLPSSGLAGHLPPRGEGF